MARSRRFLPAGWPPDWCAHRFDPYLHRPFFSTSGETLMTTVLDEPVTRPSTSPTQQLRTTMAATRLSLQWLGVRKTLTPAQKCQAAETFSADGQFLSAGKKLLDTKHPAFRAVTAVRHRIVSTWHSMTLPFPEPGLRLIRQDDVDTFDRRMTGLREQLGEAVWRLDEHYAQLKSV